MNLSDINEPIVKNMLVCAYDIQNFSDFAKHTDLISIFKLVSELSKMAISIIESNGGKVIKFIGDSALIIFPEELIDNGINTLIDFYNKSMDAFCYAIDGIKLSAHFGEIVIGMFGSGGLKSIDIFGDSIEYVMRLIKYPLKKNFILSHSVHNLISDKTKEYFNMHNPPAIYYFKEDEN